MPWIRVNEEFADDPRLDRVAAALGKPHQVAFELVFRLWAWASKHLEDGVLDGIAPASLARCIGWRGDAGKLSAALEGEFVQAGRLLDWEDVSGRLQIARKREAYRSSKRRELAKPDRVVDQHSDRRSTGGEKEKEKEKETLNLKSESKPKSASGSPPAERGKRLENANFNFETCPQALDFALKRGATRQQADDLFLEFWNYWTAKPGKDALKLDWRRTFENRVIAKFPKPPTPLIAASKPKIDALAGMHQASLVEHRRGHHAGEFEACEEYRCKASRRREEELRGQAAAASS